MNAFEARPQVYSYEYGDELADHLPMALSALRRMGASDDRRTQFARTYVRAKALRALDPIGEEALARHRIAVRLRTEGREVVLADELSSLARGLGAGAFHALIRVAYGIADADDDEIAAGLAYWRHAYLDLGESALRRDSTAVRFDVDAALASARDALHDVPPRLDDRALIARRMGAVADEPAFASLIEAVSVKASDLPAIADAVLRGFAATRNFTLLHAMTGTHATRLVLPYVADRDAFVASLWRAIVAAYTSARLPEVPKDASLRPFVTNAPAWDVLLETARSSDDEHVIKAAFTAWEEERVYGNALYRLAVARYLRLA